MSHTRPIEIRYNHHTQQVAEVVAQELTDSGHETLLSREVDRITTSYPHAVTILIRMLGDMQAPLPNAHLYVAVGDRKADPVHARLEEKYDLLIGEDVEKLVIKILMNLRRFLNGEIPAGVNSTEVQGEHYSYGNVELFYSHRMYRWVVTIDNQPVHFMPQEMKFLKTLLTHPGKLYKYPDLSLAVFGDTLDRRDALKMVKHSVSELLQTHNSNVSIRVVRGLGYALDKRILPHNPAAANGRPQLD